MDIPDILETLAELVVTMVGFMGVVVVFQSSKELSQEMYHRIQWTFTLALVVLISLLLPHFLIGFSALPSIVLGIPLGFFGLTLAATIMLGVWQQRTGRSVRAMPKVLNYALIAVSLCIPLALVFSAFDFVVPRTYSMLVLGTMWALTMIGVGFVGSIGRGVVG